MNNMIEVDNKFVECFEAVGEGFWRSVIETAK
jgi:hypothetical protein